MPDEPRAPRRRPAPILPAGLLLLALCACAGPPAGFRGAAADAPEVAVCLQGFRAIDAAVDGADVRDAEGHRITGFPYLRASRFLASFRHAGLGPEAFAAWVDRLEALDRQGRTIELANLDATARARLDPRVAATTWTGWSAEDVIRHCPALLRAHDLAAPEGRRALRNRAAVPDDYSAFLRTVGLYPLSAIPVALGYERWQAVNLPAFEAPFGHDDRVGTPLLFAPEAAQAPLSPAEVAAILDRSRANPLNLPEPAGPDLERLAATFAPAFLIDVVSGADRIGQPYWSLAGPPDVDPDRPVAFVRLTHGRFEGRPVAQLAYAVWFKARPRQGALDILAGRLDGLIWRVTLGQDGRPLVYDSAHLCGCYHLFYPAPGVRRLPQPQDAADDIRETVLVPQAAPALQEGERMVVRLAATSHFVTGLGSSAVLDDEVPVQNYRLVIGDPVPDQPLRSMPLPDDGRRSLYGPDGLVAASARLERFVFWPMGIANAGAMRQWGRHATAFVGRRHFDDPYLLDGAFAR